MFWIFSDFFLLESEVNYFQFLTHAALSALFTLFSLKRKEVKHGEKRKKTRSPTSCKHANSEKRERK
jgi:hypothetical protein